MPDLFDLDCTREGGFLGVVALELGCGLAGEDVEEGWKGYLDAVFVVPDAVGCDWRVVAISPKHSICQYLKNRMVYLTCSETSCVVPASSSHFPKNSSPRKGFRGFFSDPNLSLLLA